MTMLRIEKLSVRVAGKEILHELDLEVGAGEVHAVMGPNGSGKSTLSQVLAGRDGYEITSGRVLLDGEDLLSLAPEERAARGLFLGFQYPVEIPGVGNFSFLRTALNAQRRARGEKELDAMAFLQLARAKMKALGIAVVTAQRGVNEGFSGGEKKRNEILQLSLLEPRLCILDEIDSGLDVDALKAVAEGVNALRSPKRAMVLITHYQRLLDFIVPDRVHVLAKGTIVQSGDRTLAPMVESRGYGWVPTEASPSSSPEKRPWARRRLSLPRAKR